VSLTNPVRKPDCPEFVTVFLSSISNRIDKNAKPRTVIWKLLNTESDYHSVWNFKNPSIINIYMALLATFVGVGKHADPGIRDLIGATRDAVAMHALFVDTIPDEHVPRVVESGGRRLG
jgi:hypothetical protein